MMDSTPKAPNAEVPQQPNEDEYDRYNNDTIPPTQPLSENKMLQAFNMQLAEDGLATSEDATLPYYPFAPTPDEGFPRINGPSQLWQSKNIDRGQFGLWLSIDGPKVLIQLFHENSWSIPRANALCEAITLFLEKTFEETNVQIMYGFENVTMKDKQGPPHSFCVYGISQDTSTTLTNRRIWRTPEIHLIAYTFSDDDEIEYPTFVGSFHGLTNTQPHKLDSIKEGFKTAWKENGVADFIKELLREGIKGEDGDVPIIDQQQVDNLINDITVSRVPILDSPTVPNTHINVYLHGHRFNNEQWFRLKERIRRADHKFRYHSKGKYMPGWTCFGCHGIDHPKGLCPFDALEIDVPLTNPTVPKGNVKKEAKFNILQTPKGKNRGGEKGGQYAKGRGVPAGRGGPR